MPEISDYQRACLQLQFMVSVAASVVPRLDEKAREYALNAAIDEANISPADTIRLRAMAHKYASGSEDVQPAIKELRVLLDVEGRKALLDHVRAMTPPNRMLEDMLAAYAAELEVPLDAPAPDPDPGHDMTPRASQPIASVVAHAIAPPDTGMSAPPAVEHDSQPASAGGVRANPLLDGIFHLD